MRFANFIKKYFLQNMSGRLILVIFMLFFHLKSELTFFVVLSFSCFTLVFRLLVNTILFISVLFLNNLLFIAKVNVLLF